MNLEFKKYKLANGMALMVKENHHAQSVVISGRLRGGSGLDSLEKMGLADFTTDMMRHGTTTRTFSEINETVESMAASVYVDCGRHLTTFGSKGLGEDFGLLAEIITDCLSNPTFPLEETEKLKGQIITHLKEVSDSPRSMADRHFRELLYTLDHAYGRPISGTLESVSKITQDDLVNFYQQNAHPQGGIVVVVGDVQSQAVYETLEATLGQWQPNHAAPDADLPLPRPLIETGRRVYPMKNKSQADLALGCIGPSRGMADFGAAYLGDTILGQLGLGGRIGKSVRDEGGMAYYARTYLTGGLGPGPWYIYAGVNPNSIEKAIDLILLEIRRFREELVTEQELADAQSYLTGVLPLQMETNEGIASILMEIHLHQLGDDFIARYPDLINAVTRAEIQAVAQKYLSHEVYALSIAGPYEG